MSFLPYGRQSITEGDIAAVVDVLRSDYLTTGPVVDQFEAAIAQTVGAKEAVAVANGTAALHLAVMAHGLGPKDVVIVPSLTFAASANCVAYCGAQVVFADVDPLTGLITEEAFDAAVAAIPEGYRFAGVIPVHYAGACVDLAHISSVSRAHDAFVVEDASHAIGSIGQQGPVGSCQLSEMTTFSFHPVKTLTTGEGGAITLNDPDLARRLRRLRSHGIERDPKLFVHAERGAWVYEMQELGYNYRLPDINCALGLSQIKRLPYFAERRRRLVALYQQALESFQMQALWTGMPASGTNPVYHLFAARIDFEHLGTTRDRVMSDLRAQGIGSQVHYIPVHRQPYWALNALVKRDLPGADDYYEATLSLPFYADMSDDDPRRVVEALRRALKL